MRCDLVLLIDQFEELFAAPVSEAERNSFIDLIAALAGTGRIWVAATIRAEFYARMLDQPVLKKLKERGATYDLAFPGPVELAETVRSPAKAAGLVFETNAATGERLDEQLLRDADRPDMLPLVQLALSRLFEGRQTVGGEIRLPFRVYEHLGGLKGIVNEAGETALASLSETEKTRLPRLLRQLAVPTHEQDGSGKGALTIRAVPLAEAAPDEPARRLLDALVTSRLLMTSGTEAETQVRLTHQRVLQDWARAHTIVADSADFYRIRDDVERSRGRWEMGKQRSELLLARGLPLAEAESIVGKYRDELTPEVCAYVKASRRRANRAQMIAWGAAAVFLLLFIGAGVGARFALYQTAAAEDARGQAEAARGRADEALATTTQMANTLVFDLGQDEDVATDLRSRIFDAAIRNYKDAIKLIPNYARFYNGLGTAYDGKGELDEAIANYNQAIALDPKYADAYNNRGATHRERSELDDAIADYNEAIALNPKYADAYYNRGNARRDRGELDDAIADYNEAIALNPKYANAYYNRGNARRDRGELDDAIADYNEAIALNPKNAYAYNNRGNARCDRGELDDAIADYNEAIALNPKYAYAYNNRGNARRDRGELDDAIADYNEAIALNPKFDEPYFNRALMYVYAGSLPQALADLNQSRELDPTDPYAAIWLEIVDKRSELTSRLAQTVTQIDMSDWPAPVIRLYLGQMTADAVLAAADDTDAETKKDQILRGKFLYW